MDKDYLTVEQVAEQLQVSTSTIYTKIRNGEIPTHPWIEKPRIPKEALENWDQASKESFAERKLRKTIAEKDEEIHRLENLLRSILKITLEVKL